MNARSTRGHDVIVAIVAIMLANALASCSPGGRVALRARTFPPDAAVCEPRSSDDEQERPAQLELDPALQQQTHRFFEIRMLDQADRSPIAGVMLETVHHVQYQSDRNGRVAFYEPGLMDTAVYFTPTRDGYRRAADGFGYRGVALDVSEGGSGEILLERNGDPAPVTVTDLETRLLQAAVPDAKHCFGLHIVDSVSQLGVPLVFAKLADDPTTYVSDSQGVIAYCNPMLLDTRRAWTLTSAGYHTATELTELELHSGHLERIEVVRDSLAERLYRSTGQGIYRDSVLLGLRTPTVAANGFVMAQDAVSSALYHDQLFWIWGITQRPNYPLGNFATSAARSTAADALSGTTVDYFVDTNGYARGVVEDIAPTMLATWVTSLVNVRNRAGDEELFATFVKANGDLSVNKRGLLRFAAERERFVATGVEYPLSNFVAPAGQPMRVGDYLYYGSPLRIPANTEALLDTTRYEVFTALGEHGELALGADGKPAYAFRPASQETTLAQLTAAGFDTAQALTGHTRSPDLAALLDLDGTGAQGYNARRDRFVRVVAQKNGSTSFLGEVWYLEGDTPVGPWVYARKILTHDRYSFYAPWLHGDFADSGRHVYFEATYTDALASNLAVLTPRYNRNQIMYRLDVEDPRLALPVAIYEVSGDFADKTHLPATGPTRAASFFALDRPAADAQPVFWTHASCSPQRALSTAKTPDTEPLFYAVVSAANARTRDLVPIDETGHIARSDTTALAYVWPNLAQAKLPVHDYRAFVANAGPDRCLRATPRNAGVTVTLAGSGSSAATHYSWRKTGAQCALAEGQTVKLTLPPGVHGFTLELSDYDGQHANDSLIIEVGAP
ncbi:MAG: hypothetical protein RL701_7923 [Pseudomonadota bacterium]